MNILIFEYATAQGLADPYITLEGRAMLKGIVEDLQKEKVHYLLSKKSVPLNLKYGEPVIIKESVEGWLKENIGTYDACLPIAPEEDLLLYNLTRIIEENQVQVIGSSSEAVLNCSDKYRTFKVLMGNSNVPHTEKIYFNQLGEIEDLLKKNFKDYAKLVIKPVDGVSGCGVQVIESEEELIRAASKLEELTPYSYFLLQEFVEGTAASVSLLCSDKHILPLSLNWQDISFKEGHADYNGGYVPLKHKLSSDAMKSAVKALRQLNGLKGYVGVDVILSDKVTVLEINSRLTTPFIALRKILNFNLGEAIMNTLHHQLPSKVVLKDKCIFQKDEDSINIRVIR